MKRLPAVVAARFPDYPPESLLAPPGRTLLIGRLLEDGDASELSWLLGTLGPEPVAAWLEQRADRQLSARSRAFWRELFAVEGRGEPLRVKSLWPLS